MDLNTEVAPQIERVRYELKRRLLTVVSSEHISPAMIRITLHGEDLADFTSLGPDDHCKVIIPDENGEMVMRDYTPRAYDNDKRTLAIDFALHDAGPVTQWAMNAKPGDELTIGGPRGSAVLKGDIRQLVLIGDETALPAIARNIEEAKPGALIKAIIAVPSEADEQTFSSAANVDLQWVHRPESQSIDPTPFIEALDEMDIGSGTYIWIAAEAYVAKDIRRYLIEERGHPLSWLKASGYWIKGKADASDKNIGE